jgi:hypothetical protein
MGSSHSMFVDYSIPCCVFPRRYNGEYVQTKGLVEQIMADKIIGFLKEREQDQQPFLQYYAPYAIHAT